MPSARYLLALLVLAFSFYSPASYAQSNDTLPTLPLRQWPRVRTIDVKHIALDLKFDWQQQQAYGTAAITFSPLTKTDQIYLDAGKLIINSITLPSGSKLTYVYDGSAKNDALAITLNRPYSSNEEVTITIDYRTTWINYTDPNSIGGSFGKGLRFIAPTPTEPKRRRQIWSAGEPEANRYWFPCFDSPTDLRTTDIFLTVDTPLTAISNGILLNTRNNSDGTRTFHWKMDMPYANHNTSLVVGEYAPVKQLYDNIDLLSYSYPDEVDGTTASVERLPDMIKFFSDKTGYKYPYERYAQVFVQDFWSSKGNIMASTITENMVDDDRTHADFLYLWDVTEGEALANQWFGGLVTPRSWSDVWLSKAFALYFSGLYNEYKNGRDEFLLWQHAFNQSVYLGDWNAGVKQPVVNRHYENVDVFTGSNHPYFHGVNVLHMLRKHLGDEKWWRSINLYLKTYAGKLVTTEDFKNAIEDATGESIGWFFDQWVYGVGHPVFDVKQQYDVASKVLTLTLRQTQKPDPKVSFPQTPFFRGKLDIEIDGTIHSVWVRSQEVNVFTFTLPQEPTFLNVDFQSTWVKEINTEQTTEELTSLCGQTRDVIAASNAITELVSRVKSGKITISEKEKILTLLRNIIQGQAYWRVRSSAMSGFRNIIMAAAPDKPLTLSKVDEQLVLNTIRREKSWTKANAIATLSMTGNPKYADIYIKALDDESDRVISVAATALGTSKSPKAYNALAKLVNKPSWKNQSLMSSLNGLKALGDTRGYDIAYKSLEDITLARWTLSTPPIWDYRVFAAQTIAALGRSSEAFPLVFERYKKSLIENDPHVIFNYALLIATLGDPRGQEAFDLLKAKYKDNESFLAAANQFEALFKEAMK
jgi:aminopeptidase N